QVVKSLGDGVLATFPSVEASIRAAATLAAAFTDASGKLGLQSAMRAGIHLGEIVVTATDVFGDGVNVASRLQTAALPGQIVVSEDVWRQARRNPEMVFEELGARALKGVEGTAVLHAVSVRDVAGSLDRRLLEGLELPERSRRTPWLIGGAAAFGGLAIAGVTWMRSPSGSLLEAGIVGPDAPVVLSDFESQPGDSLLADVTTQALRIDLSQSRSIRLLPPDRVRDALIRMRRDSVPRIDVDLAREIAIREGVEAVIAGEVARVGGGFVLSARVVTADSGNALVAVRKTAADSSAIIEAIDELSEDLRREIGESAWAMRSDEPLARVTTPSLAALERYTRAGRATGGGDYDRGTALYEEAIAIDPEFAMAYANLGSNLRNAGRQNRARQMEAMKRAYELRDRLTERERYHVSGFYHAWRGELQEAADAFGALNELEPWNAAALSNVSTAYAEMNEPARAEEINRRVIEIDSLNWNAYWNLSRDLLNQGKAEEAERILVRASRLFPENPFFPLGWVGVHGARGEYETAAAKVLASRAMRPDSPSHEVGTGRMLAHLHALDGRAEDAMRAWAEARATAERSSDATGYLRTTMEIAAFHLLARGDTVAALEEIEGGLERFPMAEIDPLSRPYLELAWLYGMAGRADLARAIMGRWELEVPEEIRMSEKGRSWYVRAAIALAENRRKAAVSDLRNLHAGFCPVCPYPMLMASFDALGEPDSARQYARRYLTSPWAERTAAVPHHEFLDVLAAGDAYWHERAEELAQ
ncbi:MAG: adenylate/guanylate cyclase domain-containing protein, partial [Gemmatimonadota bacterium]